MALELSSLRVFGDKNEKENSTLHVKTETEAMEVFRDEIRNLIKKGYMVGLNPAHLIGDDILMWEKHKTHKSMRKEDFLIYLKNYLENIKRDEMDASLGRSRLLFAQYLLGLYGAEDLLTSK